MATPQTTSPKTPRGHGGTFVVDANVWIRLHQEMYPQDLFPSLWTQFGRACAAGRIKMPREVLREVGGPTTPLGRWFGAIKPSMLVNPDRQVIRIANELIDTFPELTKGASGRASADAWVIATAEVNGWFVVTEEHYGSRTKMKIPDVCDERDVNLLRTLEMFKALGLRICAKCL